MHSPDETTRVYTIPYIIDMSPPEEMAGIRVHWPVLSASDRNIQMIDDFKNGLCFGASTTEVGKKYHVDPEYPLSHLGVSLKWDEQGNSNNNNTTTTTSSSTKSMSTHIVRGMPYATMQYFGGALPTIYSFNGPASGNSPITIDGKESLQCSSKGESKNAYPVTVKSHVDMHFINSDFTWGVMFSKPVKVQCEINGDDKQTRDFKLSVVGYDEDEVQPLTVRVTLLNECTTGESNIKDHCIGNNALTDKNGNEQYAKMMRDSAAVFPTSPQLEFAYPGNDSSDRTANITIDWKAATYHSASNKQKDLLMFAMPHHIESLINSTSRNNSVEITTRCVKTFHGRTCLVRGDKWTLSEDLGAPMSFHAPRPPKAAVIPTLANALAEDIHYSLSDNTLRGASDTYFSGKVLARVARVISIAAEMNALAESASSGSSDIFQVKYADVDEKTLSQISEAAASENLPSKEDIMKAVDMLKEGVSVWLSEKAEAPFVFDKSWGGLVNCGCRYTTKDSHGKCNNTFPDCPALADVNEDFGNGYYNDHHYHYGYHMYAAAVVAKFDPKWAAESFEKVLLYVRDFANPSDAEEFFPQFRQKDWFLGSSWASGIVSAENSPHGRNEESSSEAIAAYEAIALYGTVMVDVFTKLSDEDKIKKATLVRDAGQLLTATELRATNRYWHVWSNDDHNNTYPEAYKQLVVGMLYDTMATFQTWFAPYAVVSYGIQLMPFTPIAEERDDPEWATELYPLYKEACESAGKFCVENGWSIMQAGLLAETGEMGKALDQAAAVPAKVFDSLGGLGNSLSNIIWFISTRPEATKTKERTSS